MSLSQLDDPNPDNSTQKVDTERKIQQIPSVDFSRQPIPQEGRDVLPIPLPAEDYQSEHDTVLSGKELKVAVAIEQHFLKLASVLGIDLDQTPIDYFFEDLEGGTLGTHYINRNRVGTLRLQRVSLQYKQLQESARNLSNKKSIIPGRFIFVLAHELYHVKQATFTPHLYADATKYYIQAKKDPEGHVKQEIEAKANEFATNYLKYLISIKDPMAAHFENYLASIKTP